MLADQDAVATIVAKDLNADRGFYKGSV